MKRNKLGLLILVAMIACLTAACAVSEVDLSENAEVALWDEQDGADISASSAETETSSAAADDKEGTVQPASCYSVWECPRCSNGTSRNVLFEYCDDGSRRIITSGPCGQECF